MGNDDINGSYALSKEFHAFDSMVFGHAVKRLPIQSFVKFPIDRLDLGCGKKGSGGKVHDDNSGVWRMKCSGLVSPSRRGQP